LIRGAFDPAEAMFRDLAVCTGDALETGELTTEGARRIDAHARRYTMHEERAAHAAALGGATATASSAPPAAETASAPGEVELFDDLPAPPASEAKPNRPEKPAGAATGPASVPKPARPAAAPAMAEFGDGVELF
jgi:hypothetical protein